MISACVTEADGILRWLIDGYTEWRSHGLNDPATVTTATSGYRAEEGRARPVPRSGDTSILTGGELVR